MGAHASRRRRDGGKSARRAFAGGDGRCRARRVAARGVTAPTIYYVHHGETEWNRAHRYQGRRDSPLTDEGRRQAERVARLLARETSGASGLALVSSPLGRAVATARIVAAALALPIATDERLVEVSLGDWEGLTHDEIAAQHPAALVGTSRWDWYFRAPGGEGAAPASARLALAGDGAGANDRRRPRHRGPAPARALCSTRSDRDAPPARLA
ncbi:MAG TPA: histidine phosphatase family protein [Stellaceae bacterium]|nr:histidine phosphatase family protein [Stellaceae bacterium]